MIDTRDKRSSAVMHGLPFRGMWPEPGTLDQPDRQHIAWMYRGIAAGEAAGGIACELAGIVRLVPRLAGYVDLHKQLGGTVRLANQQEGTVDLWAQD